MPCSSSCPARRSGVPGDTSNLVPPDEASSGRCKRLVGNKAHPKHAQKTLKQRKCANGIYYYVDLLTMSWRVLMELMGFFPVLHVSQELS
jgi:hypothetical protein